MPAISSWQLVVHTMRNAGTSFRRDADDLFNRVQNDGCSNSINAMRSSQMRMVMAAVGGFSMLEGILEQTMGWAAPFQELDKRLRDQGLSLLADEFATYRLAINVLKHGYGQSYERLMRLDELPFRVKAPDENFFVEGDVTEIPGLVLVDDKFVSSCAHLVEKALTELKIPRLDI